MAMVLRQGLWLAMAGAAGGLVSALIVPHLIKRLPFGVRPTDPLTFIGVTAVLMAVALGGLLYPCNAGDAGRSAGRATVRVTPKRAHRIHC
jgi:putative ABC transport system permease protein